MSGIDAPDDFEDRHIQRTQLPADQRFDLLERDVRGHARSLTSIIDSIGRGFSAPQMEQLRAMFREELADAGLRIDGPEHVDDAREDFRFLRRLRTGLNGYASKTGWVVILAVLGGIVFLITLGINTWKGLP